MEEPAKGMIGMFVGLVYGWIQSLSLNYRGPM
jgi:hypothetical protein